MEKNEYFRCKHFVVYVNNGILMVRDENANKTYCAISQFSDGGLTADFLVDGYLEGHYAVDVVIDENELCLSFVHTCTATRFVFNFNGVDDAKIPDNEVESDDNDRDDQITMLRTEYRNLRESFRANFNEIQQLRRDTLTNSGKTMELARISNNVSNNTRFVLLLAYVYMGWLTYLFMSASHS